MDKNALIESFWKTYLQSLPRDEALLKPTCQAWSLGVSPQLADQLGKLVLLGRKKATGSLKWVYDVEAERLPQVGELSIILNGDGDPVALIRCTEVEIVPFDQVGPDHACQGGEDDSSLEHWRQVHWQVFSGECRQIEREPTGIMPIVCERFLLVYT